jgi:hypothetical protein
MKAFFSIIISILMCAIAQSQTNPMVENYSLKAMDIVAFPFDMSYPITIGTISDSGELNFNFPKDLSFMYDKALADSWSDAASILFSKCDNSYEILAEEENRKAVNVGFISLSTKENPYSGTIYMTTDEKMVPYLEAYGNIDAILGSYFELVYIQSDFNYQGECTSTVSNTEDDILEALYTYDLQLKAGFNFVEYKIENVEEHMVPSLYVENEFVKMARPAKITVTSSQTTVPNCKWIGKYF